MNQTGGGEYKLLFLLPVFPDTGRVLLLDIESDSLEQRLSAMGIECRSGSVDGAELECTGDGMYDVIIAGRMPSGRRSMKAFMRSVDGLLSGAGWLVVVSPNRFGYSRLAGRGGGGGGSSSLRAMRGMVRQMGFTDVHVYSPVPDTVNPSAFISLYGSNSLEFLLGQFPDFISAWSGPVRSIFSLLIRTGIFRYVQNHYAIVAGRRGQE